MERSSFRRASATLFAAALLFAACGDDDAQTTATTTTTSASESTTTTDPGTPDDTQPEDDGPVIDVMVSGGTVEGGGRTKVSLGDEVTIRVTSDVADHIHLHGYDLMADITAGDTAGMTFQATIPGVFEVEFEDSGLLLLELEIS